MVSQKVSCQSLLVWAQFLSPFGVTTPHFCVRGERSSLPGGGGNRLQLGFYCRVCFSIVQSGSVVFLINSLNGFRLP